MYIVVQLVYAMNHLYANWPAWDRLNEFINGLTSVGGAWDLTFWEGEVLALWNDFKGL